EDAEPADRGHAQSAGEGEAAGSSGDRGREAPGRAGGRGEEGRGGLGATGGAGGAGEPGRPGEAGAAAAQRARPERAAAARHVGEAPRGDREAQALAAPAQRPDRGRQAQEEHPDRAPEARGGAQAHPGNHVLDRRQERVRDVRAHGGADRARGAQADRRRGSERGSLGRPGAQAVPVARGEGGRGPAAPQPEAQDGAPAGRLVRRIEAARQRRGRGPAGRRRRRARPLNPELSPSRLSGATFVALFVAALVVWFVLRVFEVVLLVFLAVLAAVYLSAITDLLEQRFRMPRWAGLVCAVVGSLVILAGAGALILPPVIDQTQALISALPQSFADLQGVIARWAGRYPVLRRTVLADPASGIAVRLIDDAVNYMRGSLLPYVRAGGRLFIEAASVIVMALYLARQPAIYRAGVLALIAP